jgi:ankyrin repeat protein
MLSKIEVEKLHLDDGINQSILNEKLYRFLSYNKLNETELISARNLLKQGADPNFRSEPYGRTLVESACFNRDLNFLKLLIEFGADSDCSSVLDVVVEYLQIKAPEKLNNPKKINLERGNIPIQVAIDNLLPHYFDQDYHETCKILFSSSEMAQVEYKRVTEQFKVLYKDLDLTSII